jgi:hypothetical protein
MPLSPPARSSKQGSGSSAWLAGGMIPRGGGQIRSEEHVARLSQARLLPTAGSAHSKPTSAGAVGVARRQTQPGRAAVKTPITRARPQYKPRSHDAFEPRIVRFIGGNPSCGEGLSHSPSTPRRLKSSSQRSVQRQQMRLSLPCVAQVAAIQHCRVFRLASRGSPSPARPHRVKKPAPAAPPVIMSLRIFRPLWRCGSCRWPRWAVVQHKLHRAALHSSSSPQLSVNALSSAFSVTPALGAASRREVCIRLGSGILLIDQFRQLRSVSRRMVTVQTWQIG